MKTIEFKMLKVLADRIIEMGNILKPEFDMWHLDTFVDGLNSTYDEISQATQSLVGKRFVEHLPTDNDMGAIRLTTYGWEYYLAERNRNPIGFQTS
jgi:hypothetical protein